MTFAVFKMTIPLKLKTARIVTQLLLLFILLLSSSFVYSYDRNNNNNIRTNSNNIQKLHDINNDVSNELKQQQQQRTLQDIINININTNDGKADGLQVSTSASSLSIHDHGYDVHVKECISLSNETSSFNVSKDFVKYSLCHSDYNSSCSSIEYMMDLKGYLDITLPILESKRDNYCLECSSFCPPSWGVTMTASTSDIDCETCLDECNKIKNMEANGYVDATVFSECTLIYDLYGDGRMRLYAGPICSTMNDGKQIIIGVFTDDKCINLDSTKNVDDYLLSDDGVRLKLSHALLGQTYIDAYIPFTSFLK